MSRWPQKMRNLELSHTQAITNSRWRLGSRKKQETGLPGNVRIHSRGMRAEKKGFCERALSSFLHVHLTPSWSVFFSNRIAFVAQNFFGFPSMYWMQTHVQSQGSNSMDTSKNVGRSAWERPRQGVPRKYEKFFYCRKHISRIGWEVQILNIGLSGSRGHAFTLHVMFTF